MNPDRFLTWYAAEVARDGYTCPNLDSPQTRQEAEVALRKIGAAAGLTRPEPAREPAALTTTPAVVDSATQLLPTIRAVPDPSIARQLYSTGRSRP